MDSYDRYLREIQKYKLLTAAEEIECAIKIQQGDSNAFKKLVNANLRLVVNIANKFSKIRSASIMDIIQEGNLGLMVAAEKFNYSYKNRFSTYAYAWILQYMLRYIQSKIPVIAIPQRKEELLRKISKARGMFRSVYGHEASSEELSKSLGIPRSVVEETSAYTYFFTSFEGEFDEDNESELGNLLPDIRYNPERQFIKEQMIKDIQVLVEKLSDGEKVIIKRRYNLDGKDESISLRELGAALGVSAETIRQMEKRAINRMRKAVFNEDEGYVFSA